MMSKTTRTKFYDASGRPLTIAARPLAIGGEGLIHEVEGDPALVAKVYKVPQTKDRSEKLQTMARLATPELLKIAAWPTQTLHAVPGGPVVGIQMPKITTYSEIHHLYSVAQRKKDYPDADWGFLVHAARNCSIAFEAIHAHGHLVGDVNQKNVMVSSQAIVKLVDCDSFQIRAPGGKLFRCDVGVPEYTPPELQKRTFRDVDREPNHDLFGLAVLIFHLLMMGRHPYSGVYLEAGDMPLEKAIEGGRFAYSPDPRATRMKPPPNTLPMAVLDATIISLFERAFTPIGRAGPPKRPTASEWKVSLSAFLNSLSACKNDPKHVFAKQTLGCPWCALLGSSGVLFFVPGTPSAATRGKPFDLFAIWAVIERTVLLETTYSRPIPSAAIVPRPVPTSLPPPTPQPPLNALPLVPQGLDTFFDRLAAPGALSGLLILLFAPPVGAFCLGAFGFWFVYLTLSRRGRLERVRRAFEDQKRAIKELNTEIVGEWEAENRPWVYSGPRKLDHRLSYSGGPAKGG